MSEKRLKGFANGLLAPGCEVSAVKTPKCQVLKQPFIRVSIHSNPSETNFFLPERDKVSVCVRLIISLTFLSQIVFDDRGHVLIRC